MEQIWIECERVPPPIPQGDQSQSENYGFGLTVANCLASSLSIGDHVCHQPSWNKFGLNVKGMTFNLRDT